MVENVARLGERMLSEFRAFGDTHPHVGDVRGKGFLIAIELVEDKATKKPFAAEAGVGRKVVNAALERRFMLRSARDVVAQSGGFEVGDIITLFPSFCLTDDLVDQMIEFTKESIVQACGS
jgi:adenosylmethionine-8-amino-7-oxononanoate aminotransferase